LADVEAAERVAVIGAGSWGTVIAAMLARRLPTMLWARRPELAAAIAERRENPDYLPGVELPPGLGASHDMAEVLEGAGLVVMGVPSHGFRAVLVEAAPLVPPTAPILSLSKGIEQDTLMRMTEVAADVLVGHPPGSIGVLTGPNLAKEIVAGQPAATVIAIPDQDTAKTLQALFMSPTFRVYTNPDVVGAESAGASKNVMAIAAGMAEGLGFGLNTTATLITRALAEMTRLGVAMGGDPVTFSGLAGMGDLIATCMSSQSRNHAVGFALGKGRSLAQITGEMNMVAEGVKTTPGVLALASRHGVEMPIAVQVGKVLHEDMPVMDAIAALMGREARSEVG
jgi:glycerol-3-phosphate dehydrogenase (NAD(P)+)